MEPACPACAAHWRSCAPSGWAWAPSWPLALSQPASPRPSRWWLKYVFDRVTGDRSMRAIGIGIVGLLGLGTLREVLGALQNWLTWKTRIDLQFSLTEKTVEKLQQLPVSFHRSTSVGSILTRLDRGIQDSSARSPEFAFTTLPRPRTSRCGDDDVPTRRRAARDRRPRLRAAAGGHRQARPCRCKSSASAPDGSLDAHLRALSTRCWAASSPSRASPWRTAEARFLTR